MNPTLAYELLDTSDVSRNQFLQKFKLSEQDVENGAKKVLDWFENQPFFNCQLDKHHVKNLYLQKHGSFEETKSSIINYAFLKVAVPEIFTGRDPQLQKIRDNLKAMTFCIQYPLSKSSERYLYIEFKKQVEQFDIVSFFKLLFMEFDMKMRFDYTGDTIVVLDARNIQKEHIGQLDKSIMTKATFAMQQAYGVQIKAAHFLVASDIADEWIQLAESVFPKSTPFVIHKDLESLYRSVERELLPKNLGGDQDNVDEVQGRWMKEANNWRDWFLEEDKKFI